MNSDHTKIEPLTRAAVIKGIAQALTVLARGRLTSTEIGGAVDSAMPTFEAIVATATQAGEPDQRLLAAFAGLGGQRTGDERTAVVGLVVSHAGSAMDLFPDGAGWSAHETLDDLGDDMTGDETGEAVGRGATPLEALKACAAEARRLYGVKEDGDPGHDGFGNDEPQLP